MTIDIDNKLYSFNTLNPKQGVLTTQMTTEQAKIFMLASRKTIKLQDIIFSKDKPALEQYARAYINLDL